MSDHTDGSWLDSTPGGPGASPGTGGVPGPSGWSPGSGRVGGYELLAALGEGGMGTVYRARDPRLAQEVALKLLRAGRGASPLQRARFLREAQALARVRHPGVVRVHAAGEDGGRLWIAMDLLPGGSLAERLRVGGPLPQREVARLGRALARALAAAHAVGILHRDVKPENVLLDPAGEPVLVDFGLALLEEGEPGERLTVSGQLLGTPAYAAPEQLAGRTARVGPAADLFGLGGTLYALLTARPPRRGRSGQEQLLEALERRPEPPRAHCPGLDPRLEALVLRCLERDPQARPSSADDLAEALERWLAASRATAATRGRAGLSWLPLLPAAVLGVTGALWTRDAARVRALRSRVAEAQAALTSLTAATGDLRPGSPEPGPGEAVDEGPARPPGGREARLDRLLQSCLEGLPPAATPHVRDAIEALRRADRRAASEALRRAQAGSPPRAELHLARGVILEPLEPRAALAEAERALELAPDSAFGLALRGAVKTNLGDAPGATTDLDRALALEPDLSEARSLRAALRIRAGDAAGALADAQRALELEPDHAASWINLATARLMRGDLEQGLRAVERAVALAPRSPDALRVRALARSRTGQLQAALADLDQALRVAPRDPHARYERARLRLADPQTIAQTLEDLDQALAALPDHAGALTLRAQLRLSRGDFAGALADAERGLAGGEKAALLVARGVALVELGQGAAGLESLRRSVVLEPQEGKYRVLLSDALERLGRREESLAAAREAMERFAPGSPLREAMRERIERLGGAR